MKETGYTGVTWGNPEVLEVFFGVYAFLRVVEGVQREVEALDRGMEGGWRHLGSVHSNAEYLVQRG